MPDAPPLHPLVTDLRRGLLAAVHAAARVRGRARARA